MTDDSPDDTPDDTMAKRGVGSTLAVWLLLAADRRAVTGVLLAGVLVALVAGGAVHPTPVGTMLSSGDPVETLFQALVAGIITGVTLVLTLSQLVLSQELGAVGDQRERMDGSLSFRRDVEAATGVAVSPAEPSAFFDCLVRAIRTRALAVADAVDGDPDFSDRVTAYTDSVVRNADDVIDQLEGAEFGEFDVVLAALNYNYSWKIYAGRRLAVEGGDDLSDDARAELDALLDVLELFGPAREHFKTLYVQWELSALSRRLLYAALPALVAAVGTLLFFDAGDLTGATLGLDDALLVVSFAVTVSLVPFVILLAYVLRIVTVTQRTLAIGPFVLRETNRSSEIDWE